MVEKESRIWSRESERGEVWAFICRGRSKGQTNRQLCPEGRPQGRDWSDLGCHGDVPSG